MKIKQGVIMSGLDIRMREALITADLVWSAHGQELVVTSALEGTHSPGSLHYYGLALDFRTYYFDEKTLASVYSRYCSMLEKYGCYVAVKEPDHIHVQYKKELLHG